jgi:hypothetical protein
MDFMTENNKMWISGELIPKVLQQKMKGVFFLPGELVPKIL